MNTPPALAKIQQIHARYEQETGYKLRLAYDRESAWQRFLHDGFTEDDLVMVIRWIKSEIREGRRWESSLMFRNLVAQPDRFEEDLSVARAHARKPVRTSREKALESLRPTATETSATPNTAQEARKVAINALEQLKRDVFGEKV